jgi:5-formyltetrahydrofolate cyclo-ligase
LPSPPGNRRWKKLVVTKVDLRRELLKKRLSLSPELRSIYDRRIVENLYNLPEFKDAGTVLLYCAVKGEPDITPIFERVLGEGKGLVLPKVEGEGIKLISVRDPLCLTNGTFNIPEPSEGVIIEPEEVELAVIPGIGFDREGYRIGFGKGYYDRLLERVSAPKVGVAYSFQVLGSVPRDSWDKPVDIIVTEKEVIRR